MLAPLPARSACSPGAFAPNVAVAVEHGASFTGIPFCGWPGGTPLAIYWAASRSDARTLAVAEQRLRCEDDPALFAKPWASIAACVHGLWTRAAERAIRVAERARRLALVRAATIFPPDPGVVRCRIPGPFARAYGGLCGVRLTGPPSRKLVRLVEAWSEGLSAQLDGARFDGDRTAGSGAAAALALMTSRPPTLSTAGQSRSPNAT
jgi:hypothetical protein